MQVPSIYKYHQFIISFAEAIYLGQIPIGSSQLLDGTVHQALKPHLDLNLDLLETSLENLDLAIYAT